MARDGHECIRRRSLREPASRLPASIGLSRAAEPPRELFLIDGNSLVYRAFFALPESIATSKGQPTNAIFGFASMLVKILTEYGVEAHARGLGRGHVGPRARSTRSTRRPARRGPTCSRAVAALPPARGRVRLQNVRVEGYEADDVIATLAVRAREQGIEVMVVTGDRDLFQLVEPGVRVMATEPRHHRDQGLRPRGGDRPLRHRARADPRLRGPEGRHLGQHPGRPRHRREDRLAAAPGARRPRGRAGNIDKISGAKRKENLTNHAEDARISKQLATAIRDVELGEIDLDHIAAREPDRSRLREMFREFELREPLGGSRRRSARARRRRRPSAPRRSSRTKRARGAARASSARSTGELVVATRRGAPAARPASRGGPGDARRRRPAARPVRSAALRRRTRCSSAEAETLAALRWRAASARSWPTTGRPSAVSEEAAPRRRSSTTRWSPPT